MTVKKISITVLDRDEMDLVQRLRVCGLTPSTARIVVCLMVRAGETISEIAAAADLTTSTVSMALKELREEGIVATEKRKDTAHGRSALHYRLNGGIESLFAALEASERRKVRRYMDMTARVKDESRVQPAHYPPA